MCGLKVVEDEMGDGRDRNLGVFSGTVHSHTPLYSMHRSHSKPKSQFSHPISFFQLRFNYDRPHSLPHFDPQPAANTFSTYSAHDLHFQHTRTNDLAYKHVRRLVVSLAIAWMGLLYASLEVVVVALSRCSGSSPLPFLADKSVLTSPIVELRVLMIPQLV